MAAARRISLFRRRIVETVSPAAVEVLIARAARISEGQVARDGRYYGSTMLTIDLERIQDQLSEVCDVATATRLARLIEQQPEVHEAAARLALQEARRVAGRRLRRVEADVRVRTEGVRVFIDVDVEADASLLPAAGQKR
jgi:hypothetical protein